jgi:aminoglycoside phosphotransferase (APT) family kinase protein
MAETPEENPPTPPPEIAPVREGEELDERVVETYLKDHIPGLHGKLEVLQFPGGHANLTYQLRFGERELVLRRPPLGPIAPRSHDMAREYKVLRALEGRFSAAPRAYLLCEDTSVIGALFIVMERCRGTVPRRVMPLDLEAVPDARRRMSEALIDTLVELHSVDYQAAGLADLGRPEGFVERQVRGWKQRWDVAKNVDIPEFDEHYAWLLENLPAQSGHALVHNDFKFDNTMFESGNPDRIVAVLDWDMTTLGDPLLDLGTLLGYWKEPGELHERGIEMALTASPGFLTRRELAERYARRRGIEVERIDWYEAFAVWKIAVIVQQIYIRFLRGQTTDTRFAIAGQRVATLIEIARSVVQRAPPA